ncbi:DUF4351 domain-containing protein [Clostridium celatum]|uniref:DUF4351 domain-containing protein n=1 Tax=Clostridium celatum TaxID=36834 RepID=UPI001897031C|nr:DUF4351 domain-containing protein [Clostridium celatum]MDU2265093.1 DUF4351 domain-containing protein [Clostridium celatum]MDU3722942.1 DUF4351 domain-containing protein [Clostridium celatum]MDU6294585.1 DUF4351 domain-containing protein [Clostridium celatum]MDY3361034.1 DUF4351 domain-containing protein [Clostridium celatum]
MLNLYEEGIEDGIEKGQHLLLIKLLNKKFGKISDKYLEKLEDLENKYIINIALDIFDIENIEDLDKYLV